MTELQHPFEISYPPIRTLFIPDPGYTICASDLDRADAQVVAWDSGCERMKTILKENLDIHLFNAGQMYKRDVPLDRLRDPEQVKVLKRELKRERQAAKAGGHATNYLVHEKTLAETLGISRTEAETFIKKYFVLYPEVKLWHDRIYSSLIKTQTIKNAFGFRRVFFGRINQDLLKEAVSWIPQSTVALVINKAWKALAELAETLPQSMHFKDEWNGSLLDIEVLLQVHDELIYELKSSKLKELKPKIKKAFEVEVPYPDPLIIPSGLKTSIQSWGHCEEEEW